MQSSRIDLSFRIWRLEKSNFKKSSRKKINKLKLKEFKKRKKHQNLRQLGKLKLLLIHAW